MSKVKKSLLMVRSGRSIRNELVCSDTGMVLSSYAFERRDNIMKDAHHE
jgi:hypothetical protein